MRTWLPKLGLAAAVIAVTAASFGAARAHAQVDVVPALGYYLPLGGWTQEQDDGSGFPPLRRQLASGVLSARVAVWVSPRFAIEGTVAASPSQVAVSTASVTTDYEGGVFFASARAAYRLVTLVDGPTHDQVHWDLMLAAGVGVVHRGGIAWENTSGVTAPVVVFAAEFGVGKFRVTLEDSISWAQFDGGVTSQTRPQTHHDFIFSLGVQFRVSGP